MFASRRIFPDMDDDLFDVATGPSDEGIADDIQDRLARLNRTGATRTAALGGESEEREGRSRVAMIVTGSVAAIAVLVIGFTLMSRAGDAPVAAQPTTTVSAATIATPSTSLLPPPTEPVPIPATLAPVPPTEQLTVPATVIVEPPIDTTVAPAPVPVEAAPVVSAEYDPNNPTRWAVFTGGVIHLQGRVPDQATADEIAAKAAAVVGPGNVAVEYVIDPTAPRPPTAPLYVPDGVLFTQGSWNLSNSAKAVLDLGVTLMQLYPDVYFMIEGHTDDQGTDQENLRLSQNRVDAVYSYLIESGTDIARINTLAYGESNPIADNSTPEGRALNRRIEIEVSGLLG